MHLQTETFLNSTCLYDDGMAADGIGQAIRYCREEAGMTQRELAEKLGWPHSTLAAREQGRVKVRPPERKAIARALGLTVEDFDSHWRGSQITRTRGPGIPLVNKAPGGPAIDYEEYGVDSGQGHRYLDWGTIDDDLAFAVEVVGDSMRPGLVPGDIVILSPHKGVPKPREALKPGRVVFVRFSQDARASTLRGGCMLARYFPTPDGMVQLNKDNPHYAYMQVKVHPEDIEQLSVAVERRSKDI